MFSDDWGRHPSSCQHIIRRLLTSKPVIWVNTIGLRAPGLSVFDLLRSIEKARNWVGHGRQTGGESARNLTVLDPVILPYYRIRPIRRFNRWSAVSKVRDAIRAVGLKKFVVVTTFPNTADLVGAFGEAAHIYYCVDDFTKWPGVDGSIVALLEDILIEKADLVFGSSEELCRIKRRHGRMPVLLRHGVDIEHFRNRKAVSLPEPVRDIRRPIVGFFGAVSPWIDIPLLEAVIRSRTDLSFVFVGPTDTDISILRRLENAFFVGSVPYEYLPSYAACFDVGIIPFLVNELTASVNPLKLLEYFALGIPVVSTPIPEVAAFRPVVRIARGPEEFINEIGDALGDTDSTSREQRVEVAERNSWEAVTGRFCKLVGEVMR